MSGKKIEGIIAKYDCQFKVCGVFAASMVHACRPAAMVGCIALEPTWCFSEWDFHRLLHGGQSLMGWTSWTRPWQSFINLNFNVFTEGQRAEFDIGLTGSCWVTFGLFIVHSSKYMSEKMLRPVPSNIKTVYVQCMRTGNGFEKWINSSIDGKNYGGAV